MSPFDPKIAMMRIQDQSGRGPWQPGLSQMWADPNHDIEHLLPVYVDIPDYAKAIGSAKKRDRLTHFGCCVRGLACLKDWFNPYEMVRLRSLGFVIVDASDLAVICRGRYQCVVGSKQPLSLLPVIPFEYLAL